MSLRVLVDEDSQSRRLVRLLREAGHDVTTVNEAGLTGEPDGVVLAHARGDGRVVLTANARDFRALHDGGSEHSGVLAVCHDSDPTKDMSRAEIVRAIDNLEHSGVESSGAVHVLDAWRW